MNTYLLTVFVVFVIGAIGTWIRKRYLKNVMLAAVTFDTGLKPRC